MKKLLDKIRQHLFTWLVYVVFAWVHIALIFQVTMLTLSVVKPELATSIGNELTWKLDGRFK